MIKPLLMLLAALGLTSFLFRLGLRHELRKRGLLAILVFLSWSGWSQTTNWISQIGSTGDDAGNSIALDTSGNVFVSGHFSGTVTIGTTNMTSSGGFDVFLAKYNSSGVFQWAVQYGGVGSETVKALSIDKGGNIYVSGGLLIGQLAKFNSNGALQWTKGPIPSGSPAQTVNFTSIYTDSQSNIWVTGDFNADFTNPMDFGNGHVLFDAGISDAANAFIAKYSTAGTCLYATNFNNFGDNHFGTAITVDTNDTVLAAGYSFSAIDLGGGFLTNNTSGSVAFGYLGRFTSAGAYIWGRRVGVTTIGEGPGPFARLRSIVLDSKGNIAIGGEFLQHTDLGGEALDGGAHHIINGTSAIFDTFAVEYTTNGVYVWSRPMTCNSNGRAGNHGIAVDPTNNVIVTGFFYGTCNFGSVALTSIGTIPVNNSDGYLAKYSTNGTPIWAFRYGGQLDGDTGNGIVVDKAGSTTIVGTFLSLSADFLADRLTAVGGADAFVFSVIDANPCVILATNTIPLNQPLPWSGAGIPGGIATVTNYTLFASVKDAPYNAFGDGLHDDYPAITNAIAHCPNSNYLSFPAGTYLVGTNITINKPILLRGVYNNRSLTWTSVLKCTGDVATAAVDFNPGGLGLASTTISSGYTVGSQSIVVVNSAGFTVGSLAHLNQDYAATIAPGPVEDSTYARINQYVTVTNVSGNTIEFTPPLYNNFRASLNPILERSTIGPIVGCGMVDLAVDYEGHPNTNTTTQGVGVRFFNVWHGLLENVMVTNAYLASIQLLNSYENIIEWDYPTHHYSTNNPVFTTSRYGIQLANFTGNTLVQHNICQAGNAGILVQFGAVGNVVIYNYSDMAWVAFNDSDPTDMGDGIITHGTFPLMNLWEGNIFPNMHQDLKWGANATNTWFRNWLTLRNFINDTNTLSTHGTAVRLDDTNQIGNNIVDNVLSRFTCPSGVMYDIGNSRYTFLHGNYDFVSGTTQWSNGICQAFPPSYYYGSKPAEFGSLHWPPIGEDVSTSSSITNGSLIPAQSRWLNNIAPVPPSPASLLKVTTLRAGNAFLKP